MVMFILCYVVLFYFNSKLVYLILYYIILLYFVFLAFSLKGEGHCYRFSQLQLLDQQDLLCIYFAGEVGCVFLGRKIHGIYPC